MSKGQKERLRQARLWWKEQTFSDGDQIIKAYRKRFGVERICAMRDLLKMGVLDAETKKEFRNEVREREERNAMKREKRARRAAERKAGKGSSDSMEVWQDENFFFIAGYTSWGFPYGITWEEADRMEEEEKARESDPMYDPGYLEYLENIMEENPEDDIPDDEELPFPQDLENA